MGLHKKVDGDGREGRYLSVSPLLDGKVSVPKHRTTHPTPASPTENGKEEKGTR